MYIYIKVMNGKYPNLISKRRKARGWSQAQLASRIEMSPNYLARMERGQMRPRLDTARRVALALGVHVDDVWPLESEAA
jgi:transcriptional regulator with XRE-family HTH domain